MISEAIEEFHFALILKMSARVSVGLAHLVLLAADPHNFLLNDQ